MHETCCIKCFECLSRKALDNSQSFYRYSVQTHFQIFTLVPNHLSVLLLCPFLSLLQRQMNQVIVTQPAVCQLPQWWQLLDQVHRQLGRLGICVCVWKRDDCDTAICASVGQRTRKGDVGAVISQVSQRWRECRWKKGRERSVVAEEGKLNFDSSLGSQDSETRMCFNITQCLRPFLGEHNWVKTWNHSGNHAASLVGAYMTSAR